MNFSKISDVVTKAKTWDPRKDASDDLIRYIDIGSVSQDKKAIGDLTPILGSEAPSRARQLVQTGDILVSTVRPNLNAVARVPAELDGATASTGFSILRPETDHVDPSYLFHWVQTGDFIAEMMRQATGQSYPAVSDKIVKTSEIPLPPLEEQKRIAGILDQAAELCRLRTRALDKLNTLGQAIFHEMFGRVFVEDVWPSATLQEVVAEGTIVTYGIVQAGDEFPGGVPYIRTGDIQDGQIQLGSLRHTAPDIAAKFERSRVRSGEIVMSIRATVGTTALVPEELDGANLTQGTARIAPGSLTRGEYLHDYIRSDRVQAWIQRQVKGATFREITLSRLREMPVILPPLALQSEYSDKIGHLKAVLAEQRAGIERAEALFASLQHRAFRGEL